MPLSPRVSCWCPEAIIREPANPRFGRSLWGFPVTGYRVGVSDDGVCWKSPPELKSNKLKCPSVHLPRDSGRSPQRSIPSSLAGDQQGGWKLTVAGVWDDGSCCSGKPLQELSAPKMLQFICLRSWGHIDFCATCEHKGACIHLHALTDLSMQGFAWPTERGGVPIGV